MKLVSQKRLPTGARMAESNIAVESGTLTLKATPTSNASPPTSTADPYPAIHYIR